MQSPGSVNMGAGVMKARLGGRIGRTLDPMDRAAPPWYCDTDRSETGAGRVAPHPPSPDFDPNHRLLVEGFVVVVDDEYCWWWWY